MGGWNVVNHNNVHGGPEVVGLREVLEDAPMVRGEFGRYFMEDILPLLNFDLWISDLLSKVPEGSVTTFGSLAGALGTVSAARAVGERIASGSIHGPVHRVVYSDGRVPEGSVDLLSAEMDLHGRGSSYRIDEVKLVEFDSPGAPLKQLAQLQKRMGPLLSKSPHGGINTIAGLDISSGGEVHASGLSLMDTKGNPLGELCRKGRPGLPYIPGLLFYREAPLLLPLVQEALDLEMMDRGTLLVLDGNGTLHPRKMGIACQLGIAADMMTCGAAKRLHVGKMSENTRELNGMDFRDILMDGEVIGAAMYGPGSGKPVYVSPGNGIDLETVMDTLSRLRRTRIPEPTRRAHELSNRCRSETVP